MVGFKFENNPDSVTSGIHIWSEIFLHDFEDGRKVVILLIDTQGASARGSTLTDDRSIFSLGALLSSVQIYNLCQNIQEDNLQLLALFAAYGQLVMDKTKEKPFQKLLFLVRDWSNDYHYKFGSEGGKKFVDEIMQAKSDKPEIDEIRKNILNCFEDIGGFLMPHPGLKVIGHKSKGTISEIEKEFMKSLKELVPLVLAPENLVSKKINGKTVKAKELNMYFKKYFDSINNDKDFPSANSIYGANAEASIQEAMLQAKNIYVEKMSRFQDDFTRSMIERLRMLERVHFEVLTTSLKYFDDKRKLEFEDKIAKYRRLLLTFCTNSYELRKSCVFVSRSDVSNRFQKAMSHQSDMIENIVTSGVSYERVESSVSGYSKWVKAAITAVTYGTAAGLIVASEAGAAGIAAGAAAALGVTAGVAVGAVILVSVPLIGAGYLLHRAFRSNSS